MFTHLQQGSSYQGNYTQDPQEPGSELGSCLQGAGNSPLLPNSLSLSRTYSINTQAGQFCGVCGHTLCCGRSCAHLQQTGLVKSQLPSFCIATDFSVVTVSLQSVTVLNVREREASGALIPSLHSVHAVKYQTTLHRHVHLPLIANNLNVF